MWLIEEYAIIFFILTWFKPWIPLIKDEKITTKFIIIEFFNVIIIIIIGAIFCHVSIIKQLNQVKPSITSGNHQWNGAIPSFIKSENWVIEKIIFEKMFFSNIKIEKINKVEANLWTKKYFIPDSLEYKLFFVTMIGIIDKRLISTPIHINSHEYEVTVINDLTIRELINRILYNLLIKKGNLIS